MDLSSLRPANGAAKERKRVGRGRASGHGKTSTRGHKGQKSRSGRKPRLGFEGGQMPILRRIPKLGGFKNPDRVEYELVNVARLSVFTAKTTVSPAAMVEKGLVKKVGLKIKILGQGDLDKDLKIQAHAFSKTAREKIEAAGGEVQVI